MNLALFDLDHTLIPFDSGMAWTHFLIARGHLPATAETVYLQHARQYVAGTLDFFAMHEATIGPLGAFDRDRLDAWVAEFEAEVAPRIPASMRGLIEGHRAAGDLCAIVTATTRLISAPFARLFGMPTLLATEAATVDGSPRGRLSGRIAGEPCYREHKVTHVQRWLHGQGLSLATAGRSVFYSDSSSDLPLLEAVSEPVAVWPDARLAETAARRGWAVLRPVR